MGYWHNDPIGNVTYELTGLNEYPWKYAWEYVPDTTVRVQPAWEEINLDPIPLQGGGGGGKTYNKMDFEVSFTSDSGFSVEKDFKESDDMKKFLNDIRK